MDALSDDLRRWREGRPITARPISSPERAWRWARRRPLTAALGATLATTVILGVLSLLVLWRRAESERQRAERLHAVARANYEVASQSLREICEVAYQSAIDQKNAWSFPPYFERALEQTRARQLELSRKNALQPSGQEQLATVDLMLATAYRNNRKPGDVVRPLLDESVTIWEVCIGRGADLDKARTQQLQALTYLAQVRDAVTTEAEILSWQTRSTSIYRRLCANRDASGPLFELSLGERRLADHLVLIGQPERARRFLQEKLSLFESLLQSHPDSQDVILARALTLTALGKADGRSIASRLGRASEATPGGPRHRMLVLAIAESTARTYGLQPLGPVSRDRQRADLDETAWAGQVIRSLSEQTSKLGLDKAAILAVACHMKTLIFGLAAEQRYVGNHEDARRTARLFSAFAAELVRICPGHAEPYLLVCEAHLQDAKNASRAGDRATVGRALRQSLETALNAATVDPTSEEARRFVVDRRARLARFESEGQQVPGR